MLNVNNENPKEHWKFINVTNKVVLDLGCGRWNSIEIAENIWLTTPEYFILNGAKRVVGVDMDNDEISWFKNRFACDTKYEFILKNINNNIDIKILYETYKPNCVKFDIETGEKFLFDMNLFDIRSIEEYYIETHGYELYKQFIDIFPSYGYKINEQIDLTHTNGYCKVIFASRI